VFVSQLVHHGDVSASPTCFLERLECFFLCCLETFLDFRFKLTIPDLLAQMCCWCRVCFCSLDHFSCPAWWSRMASVPTRRDRWLDAAEDFPVQTLLVQMGGSEDTERSISHMKFGFLWLGSTDLEMSHCSCLQEGRGSCCQIPFACAELWLGCERRQPAVSCSCCKM